MIIEGKHAEVGQGIFISDIQEGSAADQAGLIVGDMILSVNKDTLLGSNYDAAASLLKKTEGVVTLVVCNPNKTKEEEKKTEGGLTVGDGKSTPARSTTPTQQRPVSPAPPEKPRILPKPNMNSARCSPTPPKSPTPTMIGDHCAAPATLVSDVATSLLDTVLPPPSTLNVAAPPPSILDVAAPIAPVSDLKTPLYPILDLVASISPILDPAAPLYPNLDIFAPCSPTLDVAVSSTPTLDATALPPTTSDAALPALTLNPAPETATSLDAILPSTPDVSPSSTLRLSPTPSICEEPAADLLTCEIETGKETTIEINREKLGLGLSIVGGSDTLLGVVAIQEIYPDGAAAKDNRLKPGDQILEINAEDCRSIPHAKALAALRQIPAKVKMIVFRDEALTKDDNILDTIDVELTKKSGKGLGLSLVARKSGTGVFIADVLAGGAADSDGRLLKGDQILSVNGQDLKSSTQEEAAAVLKTAAGKVAIKLGRLKTGTRGVAALAAKESSLPPSMQPNSGENGTLTSSQSFPRYVSKREALIRQFTNWSFRRRNL